jgi:predicted TIM-barrel fold metal-dependent hydrolase
MIPSDRILYGTDGAGFAMAAHDMITRRGLAEALEERIRRRYLSPRLAPEIAANILRNNSTETYKLSLTPYQI